MNTLFLILIGLFTSQIAASQNQVIYSVVTQYDGQLIKIYSDTMNASIYYNLTGYESTSEVVLNIIVITNDGVKSKEELEVISYIKSDNKTEIKVITEDGELKYVFLHKEHVLITQNNKGNILWEGDIIF